MADTTTVRMDRGTHEVLKRLASDRGTTVSEALGRAVRLLQQEQIGAELASELRADELEWLDAAADLR